MSTERELNNTADEFRSIILTTLNQFGRDLHDKECETNKKIDKIIDNQEKHEDEIKLNFKETNSYMHNIALEMAQLKIKSGVWGLMGGLLPAIGAALWVLLSL